MCYFEVLGLDFEFLEDGYCGVDIILFGKDLVVKYGDKYVYISEEECCFVFCVDVLVFEIGKLCVDLEEFCVFFDEWFLEIFLYEENKVLLVLECLCENGYIYE